ncbi:hypothetical protein BN2476_300188 [Paraburkholderia piptadeniae]|uniref:Uncharacterized protein n=1 Tax=Paraburkholderia piptadeniae TaxID=1701573 RepID=A0A1N7S317_9BURK|nr:hypothetical protein BN2476_300188 [Paraburkholderia piptadeniae]
MLDPVRRHTWTYENRGFSTITGTRAQINSSKVRNISAVLLTRSRLSPVMQPTAGKWEQVIV